MRSALIAGVTGLVGRELLKALLDSDCYSRVVVLSRRAVTVDDPRVQLVVDELAEPAHFGELLAVDDVYCALGTTMRQARSRARFEQVDYHLVVDLARASRKAGARRFIVVSAVGSSARSPFFYSRVKGRMEEALAELDFEAVQILRPSLLLGDRTESRTAEELVQRAAPLMKWVLVGPLAQLRPVRASEVAQAMLVLAMSGEPGLHAHTLPLSPSRPGTATALPSSGR